MGAYRFKLLEIVLILTISLFMITPGVIGVNSSNKDMMAGIDDAVVATLANEIDLAPQSDYYIHFDADAVTLQGSDIPLYSSGLSENVIAAIAKSPCWIQHDLTQQFQVLDNPEVYAALLLNASRQYTDEIAFIIAHSPLGMVPDVAVIRDNVRALYENDKWIQYADIIDYDNGMGDYYSTIRYVVLEDNEVKQFEYPRDIYYWYVVHPKTLGENAEYVYDTFWRDYLCNHNDLGYPLLKEKLADILYLWDCQSYTEPGNRLWNWCMDTHPTAVEAIGYWIGKIVLYLATGDRPGQPNIIAHEHNGYCGELQRIAVAAQRTMLLPSTGVCNIGEDHVWREFYDRGWHQNDNWWADSGGNVDDPDIYAYGWGKEMSAIYAWNGDGSIYDATATYIHPEDRNTITFIVQDGYHQPVDGARITATVVGIKDIMWIKNSIWSVAQTIWDKLPDRIKGRILQALYTKVQEKLDEIPDTITGLTVTTWNYTDTNGKCTFNLGKNHEYLFVIQYGDTLRKPWQLAAHNAIRVLRTAQDKTFHVTFLDFSQKNQKFTSSVLDHGDTTFAVSFDTRSYQLQENVRNDDTGLYTMPGLIDFFLVDSDNFERYKNGETFTCYNYVSMNKTELSFHADTQDWYLIFRNHARHTHIIVDFNVHVTTSTVTDHVQIIAPNTSIFTTPVYDIGTIIDMTGSATDEVLLTLGCTPVELIPIDYYWSYQWNTTGLIPGEYTITATCNSAHDTMQIRLLDASPPAVIISNPAEGTIIEDSLLIISGQSFDYQAIGRVDVAIDDNAYRKANGTTTWSLICDTTNLSIGEHTISAKAVDVEGKETITQLSFIVNESSGSWSPTINSFYHFPEPPTNTSNIQLYANVTSDSPFDVNDVIAFWTNGTTIHTHTMYQYANHPIQDRHEEDPLYNESNTPIYGLELGQFTTGATITYWIEARDTANNQITSDEQSFVIT
jgi:hypothetical protein